MPEPGQERSADERQPSDSIEDLQPQEDASAAVKGGPTSVHGGGGGAGKSSYQTGGSA